jgi:hypothetical protein
MAADTGPASILLRGTTPLHNPVEDAGCGEPPE